jgi:hypothetical protein
MNKLVVSIAQIAIGTVVGIVAHDTLDKMVVEPIKKAVESKKEGGAE